MRFFVEIKLGNYYTGMLETYRASESIAQRDGGRYEFSFGKVRSRAIQPGEFAKRCDVDTPFVNQSRGKLLLRLRLAAVAVKLLL